MNSFWIPVVTVLTMSGTEVIQPIAIEPNQFSTQFECERAWGFRGVSCVETFKGRVQ